MMLQDNLGAGRKSTPGPMGGGMDMNPNPTVVEVKVPKAKPTKLTPNKTKRGMSK